MGGEQYNRPGRGFTFLFGHFSPRLCQYDPFCDTDVVMLSVQKSFGWMFEIIEVVAMCQSEIETKTWCFSSVALASQASALHIFLYSIIYIIVTEVFNFNFVLRDITARSQVYNIISEALCG